MSDIENEEPLDPKVEAIRRKMMRLLMVSGGIMMVGLMTVLIAIVYKINQSPSVAVVAPNEVTPLVVPAGSKIISMGYSRSQVILTLENADGARTIRIYRSDGSLQRQYGIREE